MEKSNITLIIGDNAIGKTRRLCKIYKEELATNSLIVTNLPSKNKYYSISEAKHNKLVDTNFYDDYKEEKPENAGIKKLLDLLSYDGDILIIDEIDKNLTPQQIIDISHIIRENRTMWKKIYISGYDVKLILLFDGLEDNIIVLTKEGDKHASKHNLVKYIDEIRG